VRKIKRSAANSAFEPAREPLQNLGTRNLKVKNEGLGEPQFLEHPVQLPRLRNGPRISIQDESRPAIRRAKPFCDYPRHDLVTYQLSGSEHALHQQAQL
jgi:hypothetical protein